MTGAIAQRAPRRALAALLAALLLASGVPAARALARIVSVIVMSHSAPAAAAAVIAEGGQVDALLPIVDGAAARLPESEIPDLSRLALVVPDRVVRVQSASFGEGLVTAYPHEVGATRLWAGGVTGKGVTVAVLDTGIAEVPDLAGRIVGSADLTSEQSHTDTFGHGTFMAGLVAGDGASSGGRYVGVAPEASLVSIKVAGASGSTSLSTVLMGIQVADASAPIFHVRVLLLALESQSPLPPEIDPLSLALRQAWAHGITVVVPSGNHGNEPGSVGAPGEDPVLLTAGSVNDMGTADVLDDAPSGFTGTGPTRWGDEKPDLAAPGEHVVSLRAPGSSVDQQYPSARVEDAYFRGSGTSMSAAVTAGAAALLLQRRGGLLPDQVKGALMASANPIPAGDADSVGAGVANAADAVALEGAPDDLPAVLDPDNALPPVDGDWVSLPDGKGRRFVRRPLLLGELDPEALLLEWARRQQSRDAWAARQWAARQWAARQWAARQWAARQWAARQWAARQWAARQWASEDWAARQWAARQWAFQQWAARQWSTAQWTARSWSAEEWSARQWASADRWSDAEWAARQWAADDWSARSWSARQWAAHGWE